MSDPCRSYEWSWSLNRYTMHKLTVLLGAGLLVAIFLSSTQCEASLMNQGSLRWGRGMDAYPEIKDQVLRKKINRWMNERRAALQRGE